MSYIRRSRHYFGRRQHYLDAMETEHNRHLPSFPAALLVYLVFVIVLLLAHYLSH